MGRLKSEPFFLMSMKRFINLLQLLKVHFVTHFQKCQPCTNKQINNRQGDIDVTIHIMTKSTAELYCITLPYHYFGRFSRFIQSACAVTGLLLLYKCFCNNAYKVIHVFFCLIVTFETILQQQHITFTYLNVHCLP